MKVVIDFLNKSTFGKAYIKKIADKTKKIKVGEVCIVLVVFLLAGIVIVPSLVRCASNSDKTKCSEHMSVLINELSVILAKEETTGDTYFHDLISCGNYQKLIGAVSDRVGMGKRFPSSDYYIIPGDETLTLMCRKHSDISTKTVRFSLMKEVNNVEIAEKPQISERILYLTVSGPDTYYEGDALDSAHPDKMVFRGREVDDVINNLTVTAIYEGGVQKTLDRSQYTVTADNLNMSKSGQARLTVKSNSLSLWDNSAYAAFIISIIGEDDVAPLIVDGGDEGKFELAAWSWSDYLEEAAGEDGGKDFDASIIRYEGIYYYYPDGLHITNSNKNDNPLIYALDVDDHSKAAYCIRFYNDTPVDKNTEENTLHAGNVKVENELIYIWQEQPSKELDKGWIRVYCELSKY